MSWLKSKPSRSWARLGRVYIIPTKFGFAFSGGAILMILIGSAYQNNLVNLLGFFMLAILFTAMIATHNNIKGIEISRVETVSGFAGEHFPVSLVVHNSGRNTKSNCDFTIKNFKKIAQYDARAIIPPRGDARLLASFQSPERGVHGLSRFVLSTTAPFGLFYAWQIRTSEAVATIFPRRKGELKWTESTGGEIGHLKRASGAEDFKEHRLYQPGDSLRRVDWLAFARGRQLMSKEFDETAGAGLHFDFQKLRDIETEARLEQLTKWIDLAIQLGQPFTLSIPGKKFGPDQGLAFAHRAWTELAKFPSANVDSAKNRNA